MLRTKELHEHLFSMLSGSNQERVFFRRAGHQPLGIKPLRRWHPVRARPETATNLVGSAAAIATPAHG